MAHERTREIGIMGKRTREDVGPIPSRSGGRERIGDDSELIWRIWTYLSPSWRYHPTHWP
jgi:hypothetical protein